GERNLVLKVLEFFENEKRNKQFCLPVDQAVKRTCMATGISKTTLMRIKNEAKRLQNTSPTPGTSASSTVTNSKNVKIKDIFYPKNPIFELGQQGTYLRRLKQDDDLGAGKKPVIYIDETWIHSHYTVSKCWQNNTDASIKKNHNPGQRWIVVHGGGEDGFVNGAELIYKCKSNSGDYHHEMNTANFKKWILEKLIPNLPLNSIVVLDNAPYHSTQIEKPPTGVATKGAIRQWLLDHNITFDERMTKSEMYHLLHINKPPKKYLIDELFKEHGHEVVRRPPYIISESDWKKEVNHVDRLRQKYWDDDLLQETNESQLIVNLSDTSSSSDYSETEDEEQQM
ncbi:hypothetical protein HW555_001206, partial [Spodoptera exigua]